MSPGKFIVRFLLLILGALLVVQAKTVIPSLPIIARPAKVGDLAPSPEIRRISPSDFEIPSTAAARYLAGVIKLRSGTDYAIQFVARPEKAPFGMVIDFFGPDYDHAEQQVELIAGTTGPNRMMAILNSGKPPSRTHVRLLPTSPGGVKISDFKVVRLSRAWKAAVLLPDLVLFAMALVLIRWVYQLHPLAGHASMLGALCLVVTGWLSGPPAYDNIFNVPTSLSILSEGNAELSEYEGILKSGGHHDLGKVGGRWYPFYPIGTPLLSVPLVFLGNLLHPGDYARIDAFAARLAFALLAVLFFLLAHGFTRSLRKTWLVTLCFVFATSNFSVLSGALWSHCWTQILILLTLLILQKASRPERDYLVPLAGLPLALSFLCRPTSALFIMGIGVYTAIRHRRQVLPFAAVMALVFFVFVLWSRSAYGAWLPPYYTMRLGPGVFWQGLAGQLFSPNRGLLIYTPIFVFAFAGLLLWLARGEMLRRCLAAMVLVYAAALASWPNWWGGASYGPRLYTDLNPLLALMMGEGLWRSADTKWRRFALPVFALALAFSLFVQIRGVTASEPYRWNAADSPDCIDYRPERAWDWSNMQIFAGMDGKPVPGSK